jgi:hypothetical protein
MATYGPRVIAKCLVIHFGPEVGVPLIGNSESDRISIGNQSALCGEVENGVAQRVDAVEKLFSARERESA